MKRGWVFSAVLLVCAAHIGAAGVGSWRNYTSKVTARSVAWTSDGVWAATAGGMFRWRPADGSFFTQTTAEGLQGNDMTAVAIDVAGNVWSGGSSGALHVFTPASQDLRTILDIANSSQASKRINSIIPVGDTLLICTDFGLSIFRVSRFEFGDTFTRFGSTASSTRIAVLSAVIHQGKLWAAITDGQTLNQVAVASLSGANLLPPEAWTLQVVGNPGVVTRGLVVFNGSLYAGTTDGLYVSNGTSWSRVAGLGTTAVTAVAASASALALCTGSREVYTMNAAGTFTQRGPLLPFSPSSITIDASGLPIVATTGGGIATLSTTWGTHAPNGPNSNSFVGVAVDAGGTVWGASGSTNGAGFYRYDGTTWSSFTTANSPLLSNEFYRVSAGCSDAVWISSYGRGCVEMPAGSTSVDSTKVYGTNVGMSGLSNDPSFVVTSNVVCDGAGNAWTTIILPLNRKVFSVRTASGSWRHFPALVDGSSVSTLTEPAVDRALAVDAYDNIWAIVRDASYRGVMSLQNRGRIDSVVRVQLNTTNGLPSDDIRTIVADLDNDIWVGTDKGIGIILDPLNPTRKDGIAAYKPLPGQVINTIAVDPLNQKWIGTTEGVILLSPDGTQVLAQYTVQNTGGKLIDNDIKSIGVDRRTGTVYFGTTQGLASLTTAAAAPAESFGSLLLYPNPYRTPSTVPLTVDGLVAGSRLKILSSDGTLVRDLETPGGRIGFWDGKDENGRDVPSGIYYVVGYSPEQSKSVATGKVAVLRK